MTEAEAIARTVVEALKPAVDLLRIAEEAAHDAVEEALLPAMGGINRSGCRVAQNCGQDLGRWALSLGGHR